MGNMHSQNPGPDIGVLTWVYEASRGTFNTTPVGGGVSITRYSGTPIGRIVIPNTINDQNVVAIGNSAFANQTSLSDIVIPFSVTAIGDNAFNGATALRTFTISSNVTSIGNNAFAGATGLRTIRNNSWIPQPINATTFAGLNRANIRVQIPTGTYAAYRAAGWTGFALWEPVTVSFCLNDGISWTPPEPQIGGPGETIWLPSGCDIWGPSEFIGWNTCPGAPGLHLPGGSPFIIPSGDITLYARWH